VKRFVVGQMYCLQQEIPTSVFYPDEDFLGGIAYAKTMCNRCLARDECLEVALENWEEEGIWGGTTPKERRMIKVREALNANASRRNKPREQEHPLHESPFFPVRISAVQIRTQLVSRLDFARRIACHINGIEVSKLQSPEEFPSGHNQRPLFLLLSAELKKTQLLIDQNPLYDPKVRLESNPLRPQTHGQAFSFPGIRIQQPTQYVFRGLSLRVS